MGARFAAELVRVIIRGFRPLAGFIDLKCVDRFHVPLYLIPLVTIINNTINDVSSVVLFSL